MTDREEFNAWFEGEFNSAAVAPSLIEIAFHFWREGRRSLLSATGVAVEIRRLPEVG